jgi:hypothetical protein
MSQVSIIDIEGNHPTIPTEFIADIGTAVPIANQLEILGAVVPAGVVPVYTTGSGNTITTNVQISQAIAATDATKIGLSNFNSADFTVDANGFVSLISGSSAIDSVAVDSSTVPGTNPVLPTVTGLITVTGAQVASGTTPNVIRTDSLAANTYTIEIQRSTAVGASSQSVNGVSHYNSAQFSVDSGGFVSLAGGGQAIDSIAVQTGTSPIVPTAAGLVTINGAVVAAGTNPVRSDGTGANTLALEVQISQALSATDATKIGLANFDSAAFDVDANGFVQLNGGGIAATSFDVQANTAPGTDPVVPTAAGVVTVNGAAVVNHSVVLETRSRAANAYNLEIQYATSAAATDATKSGVAHFNSTQFSVDANGFVALAGGGLAIDSIHPDSGTDPVVPTAAGLVNIIGSGSTTTVGSLNTLTVQLTGLTNHAVLVGAGTTTITKVGPTATAGQVLQSAGAAADPAFSTATYPLTTTVSQILYSSAANTVTGLATANNSILSTDGSGVPSLGTSLNNDYTFTASTAGTVRTLTVTNTDNTNTGSGALIKAVSGGASAGDAVFQASTTTTVWSFGVDNSPTSPTADPFVISQGTALGTNNIMSVATSGEINYPLQPAFLTYLNADIGSVTGDGTLYTVVFDTEVFDQNGDLSGATFTAPVTGKYSLYAGVKMEAIGAANTQAYISLSTSNREYRDPQLNATACKTGANDFGVTISSLCDMDAADTAVVLAVAVGGTKTVGVGGSSVLITYFSGNLTV